MILRHKDVRQAARDWKTFSSDAPFRVPIPSEEAVRSVRQLPIETDPPDHTEYRKLVEPFFNRPREEAMQARIRALVEEVIDAALAKESVEAVHEIALPLQSRSLAILLGVPDAEAREWISWGVNALKDAGLSEEKGARLEQYIHVRIDRAEAEPGEDFFSALVQAVFRGRRLTREEMVGFSNLDFAGGRDTVIHSVTSILAWFAGHPETLGAIRADPGLAMSATEEFMRYISPLTHIGRVCPHAADVHGTPVAADQSVSLCWASANRDATVFQEPDEVRIDRKPNPHIAFGSGPHTCLGALHARTLFRILLRTLAAKVEKITVVEMVENIEPIAQFDRPIGYEKLVVKFTPSTCPVRTAP
ncbi:MAG: cytochrome P450 [Terrimicrobiaceae bacterium]